MIDYSKLNFSSQLNTFKNTGVFSTSITMSGNLPAGTERTFTSVITLEETQVFVFARAEYAEFIVGVTEWQIFPTFDMNVPTTPIGSLTGYLLAQVDGNVVTFIAGIANPYGTDETITDLTIPISYVTYTLAR